jgi:hypothetical protein
MKLRNRAAEWGKLCSSIKLKMFETSCCTPMGYSDRWRSELSNDFVCIEHVLDSTKSALSNKEIWRKAEILNHVT